MIIVLNGAPGCGKDTIAKRMVEASPLFKLSSMKEPMFEIAKAVLGSDYDRFISLYNDRATKEKAFEFLGGYSPRGFMIHISEDWCKPTFGDQYFGRRMLARVEELSPSEVVLSDGGFPSELIPAIQGGKTVMVVRLHREGYTFEGDSRNYLLEDDLPQGSIWFMDLHLEEGKVDDAVTEIIAAYESLRDYL